MTENTERPLRVLHLVDVPAVRLIPQDKGDYFDFPVLKFPFMSSNIPAAPAYRVYISQLIRYSRACASYQDFIDSGLQEPEMSRFAATGILQTLYDLAMETEQCVTQEIAANLFSHLGLPFSEKIYERLFCQQNLNVSIFMTYLNEMLQEKEDHDINEQCWNMIHGLYSSPPLCDEQVRKLWDIFIYLADIRCFPPTLKDRDIPLLNTLLKSKSKFKEKSCLQLRQFILLFQNKSYTDKIELSSFISSLWEIVVKPCQSGWLEIKVSGKKKLPCFTKRWFTIDSMALKHYDVEYSISRPEGTVNFSNVAKMQLKFDKNLNQNIIILVTECGIKFHLKSVSHPSSSLLATLDNFHKNKGAVTVTNDGIRKEKVFVKLPPLAVVKPIRADKNQSLNISTNVPLPEIGQTAIVYENRINSLSTNLPYKERWDRFISFKRSAKDGKSVMVGRTHIIADILPGQYKLPEIMPIRDLPPLIPRHTVIKNVQWITKENNEMSGKIIFPTSFDETIATENATSEFLSYYGCGFAENSKDSISLPYRHVIQDFTYKEDYFEDYVLQNGAGLERHEFSHLDCPLDDNSGYFIIGELYDEDIIHLTAFRIPPRHTLFVPGGCIHSNDYLKGKWRTMLSDEADIDHVCLVKKSGSDKDCRHFHFKFN